MRILFFLSIWLAFPPLFGQNITLQSKGTLPNELSETSGIVVTPNGNIWSHNDSGDDPILYQISNTGSLLKSLYIAQAQHIDWEDITKDDQGQIYIGDFGNNSNNRQDLMIYRIGNPDTISGDTAFAESIAFSYPDQQAFPPPASDWNFDCEAFFWHDDSLYLFSKNRTDPFNGYTNMYRVPASPGTFVATLVDSFFTGLGLKEQYWVTAASISPDDKRMVLLGYDKMWLFNCFAGSHFFQGGVRELSIGSITQKEAVDFINQTELYVTDEALFITGKKLYQSDLSPWEDSLELNLGDTLRGMNSSLQLNAGFPRGSYSWSTGDTSQQIEVTQSGSYRLALSLNGCQATDSVYVMLPTVLELEQKSEAFPLTVSPNPFQDYTDISCRLDKPGRLRIHLFDTTGKKVAALTFPHEQMGEQTYRLSGHVISLEAGTYLLRVIHEGKSVERRIVKMR